MKLLLLLLVTTSASVLHAPPNDLLGNVKPNAYIALFKPSSSDTAAFFRQEASRRGIHVQERFTFSTLLNGISFSLQRDSDVHQLLKIPNIQDIFPLLTQSLPRYVKHNNTNAIQALQYQYSVTKIKQAQDAYKLDGKGIKVGVIDSGVDYKHPALGGCFGQGCKVAYGYDFVGDTYDPSTLHPAVPDDDPRDTCGGHGTHVAGIIAADPFTYMKNGDVVMGKTAGEMVFGGVAPGVTLGAYRVFGCASKDGTLSTDTDIIIKAIERAYVDKMDVVNLSLGSGSSWPEYPQALACQSLVDRGVVVVAAMGNSGEKGAWQAESPAVAKDVIAVASVDSTRYITEWAQVTWNDKSLDVDLWKQDRQAIVPNLQGKLVLASNKDAMDACTTLDSAVVNGNVVLAVQSGACAFDDMARNVQDAGGVALLIVGKDQSPFSPKVFDETVKIFVAGVPKEKGKQLLDALKSKAVTVHINPVKKAFDHPTGGHVSWFSNWGPGPRLDLKPSIAAPGGLIFSTFLAESNGKEGYATLSGTSMASPFITASAAVYLQSRRTKKTTPQQVQSALQNAAHPTRLYGSSLLASVFHQGSGLIQLEHAISPNRMSASPAVLALNSTDVPFGQVQTISVTLQGTERGYFTVDHLPAVSIYPWDRKTKQLTGTLEEKAVYAKVRIQPQRLFLLPGQTRQIKLHFTGPDLPSNERWLYSGYIRLRHQNQRVPDVHVPYGGMHGAYRTLPILSDPSTSDYPKLMDSVDNSKIKPDGPRVTMSLRDGDSPYVMYRLLHPCSLVRLHAVHVTNTSETVLGSIAQGESRWLGENDNDMLNENYQTSWQGVLDSNSTDKVSPGLYKLRLTALLPFGNEKAPITSKQNWQVWDSPVFNYDPEHDPSTSVLDGVDDDKERLAPHGRFPSQVSKEWQQSALASLQNALHGIYIPPTQSG